MKKSIFIYVITFISSGTISYNACCQAVTNVAVFSNSGATTVTPGFNSALPANITDGYRNSINIKAVRDFVKHFSKATDVTWRKATDGFYFAVFINDSIQTRVVYKPNGSWNYTLRKYAENKMPGDVRTLVKSTFFDYTIIEVREITLMRDTEDTIYNILIKDGNNYKVLQIFNMEMVVVKDFITG